MPISMNDKEVSIDAKDQVAKVAPNNEPEGGEIGQGEAFPITLSPNNENHFTFNDLVSNLEMYVKAKIKESDPAVTNQTIEIVISDIENARQFLFRMNNQHNFGSSPLSAAFFGKCTVPTVFLSTEYANNNSESQAPVDATDSVVPFTRYMELRAERIPSTTNIFSPHMTPNFFVVENTQNGYHRAKFIGFEEAFRRAAVFSAHLDRTAMRSNGLAGGLLASYAPLPSLGDTSDQRPAGGTRWNGNNF